MTELVNNKHGRTNVRNCVANNTRSKCGQNRASKRSIVDFKRGSQRASKGHKTEHLKSDRSMSSEPGFRKVNSPDAKSSKSQTDAPANEEKSLSAGQPTSVSVDFKRPRPELHTIPSNILCNLSSSAPSGMCAASEDLEGDQSMPSKDCYRQFACNVNALDEQRLQYLLSREAQYHPNNAFLYYVNPEVEDKVDAALRNEAVHNLRFMHNAFFNLSTETFCKAVNLIDRFIVKVKVKPKYMACVATASYCVASKLSPSNKPSSLPDLDTVVQVTRCGGNAADLMRMEEILASKLSHDLDGVNAFDFLRIFTDSLSDPLQTGAFTCPDSAEPCDAAWLSTSNDSMAPKTAAKTPTRRLQRTQFVKRIMTRLEITLCSLEAYRFRPACLALGLMAQMNVKGLVPLANMCGIEWSDVLTCASLVEELYEMYYRDPLPCPRRPMVWNLSRRTLLRIGYSCPTPLDTITEDNEPVEEDEWLLPLLFEP